MSQSPDDDFYNSSTEITELPPQEDFLPLKPIGQPDVEQLDFPQRTPASQPGAEPGRQQAQYQRPPSQPGFDPLAPTARPISPPGFEPPDYARANRPAARNAASQRFRELDEPEKQQKPGFPPPSGPISQPGFSPPEQYPGQRSMQRVSNPRSGEFVTPWNQQPGAPAQQPIVPPREPRQSAEVADWPTVIQPPTPTRPRRSSLMLVVAIGVLVLLLLGSGTFVFFSRRGNTVTPVPQNTSTAHKATLVATHSTVPTAPAGGLNGINTPVQAGTDWIVTVTSVRTTTSSLIAPNAGNTYLEVHLTLKNTSSKALMIISIFEFVLTDTSGHRYNETATDTNVRRPPDGNIGAHQSLSAQLAYQVPRTRHSFVLTFAYGLSTNSSGSVAWRIAV